MHGISFYVEGEPRSKGSKSMMRTKTGRYIMVESGANKLKKWMRAISEQAVLACGEPVVGPVFLTLDFYFKRPKSVSKKKRKLPHVKPDLDKLQRAVNDALQSIAFKDDSQVTTIHARKLYSDNGSTGVLIGIYEDKKDEQKKNKEKETTLQNRAHDVA